MAIFSMILSLLCGVALFLFGMSFGNIPYTWGVMMLFTTVRYFQLQKETGTLNIDEV